MKSNKDENEPLKIEIDAKMKKIKAICASFCYIDDIYLVSTEISLKIFFFPLLKVPVYHTIWILTLQYENNLLYHLKGM